jgi:hypothetical protein
MEKNFILSNGEEVTVKGAYDCDKSTSLIDVYDSDNILIAEFNGTMPDFDDEDYDEEKFIKKIEEEISWYENY